MKAQFQIMLNDYKIRCYNLQNKLTPHEVKEGQIAKMMRAIKREKKCDELTAYKVLKKRLENELIKKAAENAGK